MPSRAAVAMLQNDVKYTYKHLQSKQNFRGSHTPPKGEAASNAAREGARLKQEGRVKSGREIWDGRGKGRGGR